jgi:predicted glycoside hydrolase/deacetylase ChbG (UPF0249 family)
MTRRIIVCADDYGQSPSVDDAIIDLIQKGRICATTCLVQVPRWPQASRLLSHLSVDVGLHLDFTSNEVNTLPTSLRLPAIWTQCYLRMSQKKVTQKLNIQWDKFCQAMSRQPDFIDGHQHVHTLPVIRDALLDLLYQNNFSGYLRSTFPMVNYPSAIKSQIIALLGGRYWHKQLIRGCYQYNQAFGGVYHFADFQHYRRYFQHWLKHLPDRSLIMCHPGLDIGSSLHHEYQYFMSQAYLDDLKRADVELSSGKK